MRVIALGFLLTTLFSLPSMAEEITADIHTVAPNGDQVTLHPNDRWEFVDSKKSG
ncbi:MAG: hypothetical protein ABI475_01740 [Methylophilaceae bacterium]